MSTELLETSGQHGLLVNSFWGGNAAGRCLQFTPADAQYAQLTRHEVVELAAVLARWLESTAPVQA